MVCSFARREGEREVAPVFRDTPNTELHPSSSPSLFCSCFLILRRFNLLLNAGVRGSIYLSRKAASRWRERLVFRARAATFFWGPEIPKLDSIWDDGFMVSGFAIQRGKLEEDRQRDDVIDCDSS